MNESIGGPSAAGGPPPSPWTDRRLGHLLRRWSQGIAADQIAKELGGGLSRCAVLAKVSRLGINRLSLFGGAPGRHAAAARDAAAPRRKTGRGGSAVLMSRWLPPPRRLFEAASPAESSRSDAEWSRIDAAIAPAQRCSLLELSSRRCRWPVGDPACPDFFFCGAKPVADKPYCAAHCARAYRPPQPSIPQPRRRHRHAYWR
jgi:GcrA cell cycle regulator